MQYRMVTGDERDRLLGSRKTSGLNYQPYNDILTVAKDGDVVAVAIENSTERGEKIRFSRAARNLGKSLTWLPAPNQGEIAFQIGQLKPQRSRAKRSQQA